jgi:diguanylate cyclase (GGDEF)-like protein
VQTVERAKAVQAGYLAAALRSAHEEHRARRRRETMARWLEREAATDRLTGLLTDAAFSERLASACTEARSRRRSVAIIIADVTGTQMVNRAHGDHVGDDMLRRAAVGISRCIRGNDSAGRVGGDEFAIVLDDADIETARRVARRIAHEIDRLNVSDWDGEIPVTLTFGVASGYACGPEQLLEAARAQLAPQTITRTAYLASWGWRDDDGPSVA